ncbi:MAG: tRNA 2-thiouridine(34) synthase MnmA [Schleiferiaceae bacterium]|nr:MAG: tRNA 2-thiouridine(34) synthase MnmA [Owenweeksia sp. TMED14]|tara:strand:- start:27463 stop:28608 length:1146 start_codon:yes stop_codon:yes gene_type:complete
MGLVVVGLSGGVDSSVAAHILKQKGHHVIGLFMRNWVDDSVTLDDECPWIEDSNDALLVAEKLNIPFHVLDLSKEYKERIVDYMFSEYQSGRTPNPDILCNREIKFDIFLEAALDLGADYVATGHYVQKTTTEDGIHHLIAGTDKTKDQSYFLCQLNQQQLSKALFPIGNLHKSQVREIALDLGLVTATKKDSQGLCFIGKVSLPDFLQQKLKPQRGEIIEVEASWQGFESPQWGNQWELRPDSGKVVGSHNGAYYFTIGQRKGLFVGGKTLPLFVIAIDVKKNIVYVGQGENHPGLYRPFLKILNSDIHWVDDKKRMNHGESRDYSVRIRYRQKLFGAKIEQTSNGLKILSIEPMKSVAPGQFASWYDGDELVGSGIIHS